jgi:hypothetical protein
LRLAGCGARRTRPPQPILELIEIKVNDRREVKRQQLGHDQPADHGHAQRLARTAARTDAKVQLRWIGRLSGLFSSTMLPIA